MPETLYQRLTWSRARTGFGVTVSRCSLWLGEDHVLSVDSNGYSESYKRFYFRDIQAIVLTQTRHWPYWGLFFGFAATVMLTIAVFSGEILLEWSFGALAVLFLAAFVYNFAAGPTCVCELQTAVQTEQMVSLNRIRRARRVIGRLSPLISAAQGEVAPEKLAELGQTITAPAAEVPREAGPAPETPGMLGPEAPPVLSATPPPPPSSAG